MSITKLGYERFSQITAKADASATVLKGAHVASFASGNGYAKTATATMGIVHIGRAKDACDNSAGGAGAKEFDVDLEREVFAWKFKNDGTTPVEQVNFYGKVYLSAANTVSPNSGLLTSMIARFTDIRAMFLAHAAGVGAYHGSADGATYTIAVPTTAATLYSSCTAIRTSALTHVVKVSGGTPIHGAADVAAQGALSALITPTTLDEAKLFVEMIAGILFGSTGHTARISPAVHGAADATNVLTVAASAQTNPLVGRAWFIDSKTGLVIVEPLEV